MPKKSALEKVAQDTEDPSLSPKLEECAKIGVFNQLVMLTRSLQIDTQPTSMVLIRISAETQTVSP